LLTPLGARQVPVFLLLSLYPVTVPFACTVQYAPIGAIGSARPMSAGTA
jgi:hypothetical protein